MWERASVFSYREYVCKSRLKNCLSIVLLLLVILVWIFILENCSGLKRLWWYFVFLVIDLKRTTKTRYWCESHISCIFQCVMMFITPLFVVENIVVSRLNLNATKRSQHVNIYLRQSNDPIFRLTTIFQLSFWPRALLKGPKRSFVVLVLVLGVESSSKNVTNGTNSVCKQNVLHNEQKMFQREQKMFANKICSTMNKKPWNGNKKCLRTKLLPNRTKNKVTKETKNVSNSLIGSI